MDDMNRQWRVARYPERDELIGPQHFEFTSAPVPQPRDGEFLVRTICLATGPAQRGYLEANHDLFPRRVAIGEVMRGRGIGQIVASRHPGYREGEIFVGSLGWQDYSIQVPRGAEFVFSTKTVRRPVRPLSTELGILGQAGVTAYFGLLEVGAMKPGDRVLVSAAAGGVGSTAGQIARIREAGKVVGITGSDEKCSWLIEDLGFDAAINYKAGNLGDQIADAFPDGIDVFYDNVGGDVLDAALANLAMHARIVICGFISTDYSPEPARGPVNYRQILYRRARLQGFVVFDYWERWPEAERELQQWHRDGALVNTEDVDDGLEKMPGTLASLFTGGNRGVKICRVRPDPADYLGSE